MHSRLLPISPGPLRDLIEKNIHMFTPAEQGGRGVECGPGWFDIVEDFLEKNKDLFMIWDVKIALIKEKFGYMRIHLDAPHGFYESEAGETCRRTMRDAIILSHKTCEVCGKSGKIGHIAGWLQCLCKKCKEEKIERRIQEEATWEATRKKLSGQGVSEKP